MWNELFHLYNKVIEWNVFIVRKLLSANQKKRRENHNLSYLAVVEVWHTFMVFSCLWSVNVQFVIRKTFLWKFICQKLLESKELHMRLCARQLIF